MANYADRIQTTYTLTIPENTLKADLNYNECFTKNGKPKLNIPLGEENGKRAYLIPSRSDLLGYDESASIYDSHSFAVVFPDYYTSFDNPEPVPFLEKFKWAKENDPDLYSDLSKLVVTSNYLYIFDRDHVSPYFSANFSVTKEIGDLASISFYANNFFNNMGQVYSTKTGTYSSVNQYIPRFYYGLTVRFKF